MKGRRQSDPEGNWERFVTEALRGPHLHEPPEGLVRRAIALGPPRSGKSPSVIERWVRLLFDSALAPLPAGVRQHTTGERRLLFGIAESDGTNERQLDLRLTRSAGTRLQVTGQLLPPWPGASVEARAARTRRRQRLGEQGEFVLRGLPAGATLLRLELHHEDSRVVEIPDIELLPVGSE